MHCKIHQNGEATLELENLFVDKIVKEARKGTLTVVPQKEISLTRFTPKCDQENHQFSGTKVEIKESEWTVTPEGQTVVSPQQEHKKHLQGHKKPFETSEESSNRKGKTHIVQSVTNVKSSLEPTQT